MATSEKRKPVLPKPGLFDGIGALDVLGSGTERTLSPPKALSGRDKQHEDGKGFSAGSKKGIAITCSGVAAGASRYRRKKNSLRLSKKMEAHSKLPRGKERKAVLLRFQRQDAAIIKSESRPQLRGRLSPSQPLLGGGA